MTTDIVEMLRKNLEFSDVNHNPKFIASEVLLRNQAADEIERLWRECKRLREVLKEEVDNSLYEYSPPAVL